MNIQIKKVGDSFKLVFETNWVAIIAKFLLSSKVIRNALDKFFSTIGKGIDSVFEKLFPALIETEQTFDSAAFRLEEISNLVDQLNDAQVGYLDTLRYITHDAKALAMIEREYQKNKKEAESLNSGYLKHLADQNNMLAKMAHHVSSMRRATDAFRSSVTSYIDALETQGFTNLQKELFMTLKGFIRGPLQNFNKLIKEANDVLIEAKPALKEAKAQEKSLKVFQKLTTLTEKIQFAETDAFLKELFKDQLAVLKKGMPDKDDFMKDVKVAGIKVGEEFDKDAFLKAVSNYNTVLDQFMTSIPTKELEKLGGDDGIIATLTDTISDANDIITINTGLLDEASGGLMTLVKESLKTGFEEGKTKEELITDINAVASVLKEAGLDIQDFIDYINQLTPKQHGGAVSAGRPYLVGEKGPELFSPSRSGWITPNHQLASGGHNDVVVNIYDGTGQKISAYDSSIRVEINERAGRFNEFPALAA